MAIRVTCSTHYMFNKIVDVYRAFEDYETAIKMYRKQRWVGAVFIYKWQYELLNKDSEENQPTPGKHYVIGSIRF